jgi:hypothetical protein
MGNIFQANFVYRRELEKWDNKGKLNYQSRVKSYFVIGCLILRDGTRSKCIAYVDFDCKEAVDVVVKALDSNQINGFPSVLKIEKYN